MKKTRFIAILLIAALIITGAAGCRAYKKHSDSYSKAKGTWKLDCIYVDTKPIPIVSGTLTLDDSKGGTMQVVTEYIPDEPAPTEGEGAEDEDDEDEVTENDNTTAAPVQKTETTTFSDGKTGEITGTSDAFGSLTYEFNVDTEAEVLHLYCMAGASQYHYIFLKETAE